MSLSSEITRIQNAKAAIKTAIAAKGVDVGDGKLDTYATKIREIVTGDDSTLRALISGTGAAIEIPSGVTTIRNSAFYNYNELVGISIPDSVTAILVNAFCNCNGLSTITLPESSTTFGNYVFQRCVNLTKINIPTGTTTIPNYFADDCRRLQSLTIPENVATIGISALNIGSADYPATITMKPATPPTIQPNTIGSNVVKIIVPVASLAAYRTATNWAAYAEIIEADEPLEIWFFHGAFNMSSYGTEFNITFLSDDTLYHKIRLVDGNGGGMYYDDTMVYFTDEQGNGAWLDENYQTIALYETLQEGSMAAEWLQFCAVKLAETWVLNKANVPNLSYGEDGTVSVTMRFVSNGKLFSSISGPAELYYDTTLVCRIDPPGWIDEAYQTIALSQAATGDFLEWLRSNGNKK